MATLAEAQRPITDFLAARLRAAGCVRGRFIVSGAAAQFSLTGERADGKPVFFWDFKDALFNRLVTDYLEAGYPAGSAGLVVDIKVASGRGTYQLTTEAQQATIVSVEQQRERQAKKNRRRDRTPYGAALAEQVAAAVAQGKELAPYHRDYCGMGFDYRNQEFRYGEVWDGHYMEEPTLVFASREAFVAWLAQQSDQSLSRVEDENSWYWDNQTITRQRLENFVSLL